MHTLTIAALSTPCCISQQALHCCAEARRLFVQTAQTPCILPLTQEGLCFETMDALYEQAEDFDALQESIFARLLAACAEDSVTYALPGRGMGAALRLLLARAREAGVAVSVLPGIGYAEAALAQYAVAYDTITLAAANALPDGLDTDLPLAIEELDTKLRAGEVKLALQEYYPAAQEVYLYHMEQDGGYTQTCLPLYELDRQQGFHATTVLYVPPLEMLALERHGYRELERITRRLRAPGGCPWDYQQTHESLKKNLIEECYEVLDAIDRQDDDALAEELGDVLLQCVFHAEIARQQARFTGRDVTTAIVQKLIYRHPHVFGGTRADTPGEVLENWEKLKKKEKHLQTQAQAMQSVPRNLPALMRAVKVQKKAAQVGFDWSSAKDAIVKLTEEIGELTEAMQNNANIVEEMGDIFFSAVNVARLLGLEPEEILGAASDKFIDRFTKMEQLASVNGKCLDKLELFEQDLLWSAIKSAENGQN